MTLDRFSNFFLKFTFIPLVLFCISNAFACSVSYPDDKSIFPYEGPFDSIALTIKSAIKAGRFRPDDFEKLDFSLPDGANYGDNPEFEIFNPYGPFRARVYPDFTKLDGVFSKNSRVFFILRRSKDSNGRRIVDQLFGIVTGVDKDICRYRQEVIPQLSGDFNLTPSTEGVISDAGLEKLWLAGLRPQCIRDGNDNWFYISAFASRAKAYEADPWSIAPGEICDSKNDRQFGITCKYRGWQPQPLIPEVQRPVALDYFKHPEPPSMSDYVAWISRLSGLYILTGTIYFAFSMLIAAAFLLLNKRALISFPDNLVKPVLAAFLITYLSYLFMNGVLGVILRNVGVGGVIFICICSAFFFAWDRSLAFSIRENNRRHINTFLIFFVPLLIMPCWWLLNEDTYDSCGFLKYERPR